MGGIAGILHTRTALEAAEIAMLGGTAQQIAPVAAVSVRPRSTVADDGNLLVAVAGHFDRAPDSGQSAADALMEGWRRRGRATLDQFEGAWVAVVLERRERRLNLLRDPFGVRRLFFSWKPDRIAFNTHIGPLLTLPWVSREIARENLAEYLSFRYVHAPRTLLRDVYSLPPGHHAVFDESGLRSEPWFKLQYAPPYHAFPDDEEAIRDLERRMNRAVAARASGRGRVGVFLSGGLDSSAITAVASRFGPVHTFTVGVADGEDDETPYAGRVATILRAEHHVVRVNADDFLDLLPEMVEACDVPLPDPAAIPQALLAKAAKEHVDVVLCGDGGDEVFGGRMVGLLSSQMRLSAWLRRLPSPGRRVAMAAFGDRRPELAEPGLPFGLARNIGGTIAFSQEERAKLMRDPGWLRPGIRRAVLEPFYREVVTDPVNEILHVYLRGRMAEDALVRTGAAASCVDMGVRAPLLDRDLVGFLAAQPGPWKVRASPTGSITKWPLRQLLRPILSRGLVNRPKRVLPGPWQRWFQGPLRPFLSERVAALREDPLRLWMPEAVQGLADGLDQPGADARLWVLILLDLWIRKLGAI